MDNSYENPVIEGAQVDPFAGYVNYREELAAVLRRIENGNSPDSLRAMDHLDGLAYHRLRKGVVVETRRAYSTFFTSSSLRNRLVAPYRNILARGATVLDPACGIGDLLLAAANLLPRSWPARRLENHIATHFHGREVIPLLAAVAQDRLQLAIRVVASSGGGDHLTSLPLIQAGDGLSSDVPFSDARLVLLNPPYGRKVLSRSVEWSEGLISEAAPFTLEALERCRAGTAVAAILPDVLRSGSRYAKWRQQVEKLAHVDKVEIVGLFDAWTDVDVFLLNMRVRSKHSSTRTTKPFMWYEDSDADAGRLTLADVATISIGDVVPHRHIENGSEVPYLSIHSTPIGTTISETSTRRFQGRLHEAPFLVARRTSAPTRVGGSRLALSLISSALGSVAVENHLIVIKPYAEGTEACTRLMQQLDHPSVTTWLDMRLRTRHLTKQALLELPLPEQL